MTVYRYEESGYLLDINPASVVKSVDGRPENGRSNENRIDARWVDMQTGLYIDITALTPGTTRSGQGFVAADGYMYLEEDVLPLRMSIFEGMEVYVPALAQRVLADEYGNNALMTKVFNG